MQDRGWHGVEGLRRLMRIQWMTVSEHLEAASGAGTCSIYYVRIDRQPVVESISTTETNILDVLWCRSGSSKKHHLFVQADAA